jgi:hypothetical protein
MDRAARAAAIEARIVREDSKSSKEQKLEDQ